MGVKATGASRSIADILSVDGRFCIVVVFVVDVV